MIILFHSLCFVGRVVFHVICDKLFSGTCFSDDIYVQLQPQDYKYKDYTFSKRCVNELKNYNPPKGFFLKCRFDEETGIKFFPPVYAQRYNAVKESMIKDVWQGKMKKVLDVGCAELSFFPFLKNLPGVEEVIAVDVDAQLLESVAHRVGPLLADHLSNRTSSLHVMVLAGNIAQLDPRLLGTDAVVAIELIEHLYPGDLEEVPFTIFGFIRPNVAFITTPNADFNILFGQLRGFRHPDHKFEWSRLQFQDWALNIIERYPEYEVTFQGIGTGPIGSEHLGCCSQMAIFTKKELQDSANKNVGTQTSNDDINFNQANFSNVQEVYKVIADYQYPVYVDNRTDRQKMQDSAGCVITNAAAKIICERQTVYDDYGENDYYYEQDYDDNIYIPLEDILKSMDKWQLTECQLRELLEESKWDVKEEKGKLVVDYPYGEEHHSTVPEDEEIKEEESYSEKAAVEFDWDQNIRKGKEWCPIPQNLSPTPSCLSDWNEDDTQARANVDSGYPNSFSALDKDFGNSVDLHGSSLEEDSEDEMEEDMENGVADLDRQQGILPVQDEDMDNRPQFNAAPIPELFYEVVGNQDENQDVVNNNRDNEGNNAEAVFEVEQREEPGLNVEDGSDSEGEGVLEQPSEEESELEGEQIGMVEEEEELVERLLQRVQLPRRRSIPRREPPLNHHLAILPTNNQQPVNVFRDGHEAAGDIWQDLLALPADDPDRDEGFAEAVAPGPAIAVAPVDEGGAGEPSPF